MGWVLFALMLGFGGAFVPVREGELAIDVSWFLPLLAAWAAHTRGWSGVRLAVALAPAAAIRAGWQVTDNLSLWYGLGFDSYLLGVASALAFVRPSAGELERWLRPRWRVALAALLGLLSLFAALDGRRFGVSLVGASLLAFAAAAVRWRDSVAPLRERLGTPALLLAALGAGALLFDFSFNPAGHEEVNLGARGVFASSVLCVAGFLGAVSGVVDWRWLVASFAALFAAENLWYAVQAGGWAAFSGTFTAPLSAALLGAALSPFWRSQGATPATLQGARGFVLALLAVQALPTWSGYADGWSVAGTGFLCGLVFRIRGLLVGPLALVVAHAFASIGGDPHQAAFFVSQGAWIGWLAFAFAFFGLLCNRFAAEAEPNAEPAA